MLPAGYRLQKDRDIRRAIGKGYKAFGLTLGLKFLPNKLEKSRFCFVISTKISKKAVKRNKLKRQLREIIRLNLDKISPHYDVVILTKPKAGVLEKDYQELEEELLGLLKRAKLM